MILNFGHQKNKKYKHKSVLFIFLILKCRARKKYNMSYEIIENIIFLIYNKNIGGN